jgi:hypothetical protein
MTEEEDRKAWEKAIEEWADANLDTFLERFIRDAHGRGLNEGAFARIEIPPRALPEQHLLGHKDTWEAEKKKKPPAS